MINKYPKFIFKELQKSAVVNHDVLQEDNNDAEFISDVVMQHFGNIIPLAEKDNPEVIIDDDTNEPTHEIDNHSYELGFKEAQLKYEMMINQLKFDNDFVRILENKISAITPTINIEEQLIKLSSDAILAITKKLLVLLPVDFEQVIKLYLLDKLTKYYKEGKITIFLHPDRYDFCHEILQLQNLPEHFKSRINLVKSMDMPLNDCKIECNDTTFEYNQADLVSEIEYLVKQFKL